MLVLMAIVTTFMAGPALRLLDPRGELSSSAEEEIGQREPGAPALRSIVVAPQDDRNLPALLAISEPLARSQPPRELVIVEVQRPTSLVAGRLRDQDEVARASRRLDDQQRLLARSGLSARVAAFTSGHPGRDYVRIASRDQVDLILVDGRRPVLGEGLPTGAVGRVLDEAPCDVAVLIERRDMPLVDASHAVAVPFGGAEHDWAALELGASVASSRGARLRLIGSAGTGDSKDAGRLLEQAATVVRGFTGLEVEPLLTTPGSAIVDATKGAGLLVVGLAEGWREQGLGDVRSAIARQSSTPVLFVRRGRRPGLLAPEGVDLTRIRWSSIDPPAPREPV
jgi:nucleotide-binding universal stress UspA family protein